MERKIVIVGDGTRNGTQALGRIAKSCKDASLGDVSAFLTDFGSLVQVAYRLDGRPANFAAMCKGLVPILGTDFDAGMLHGYGVFLKRHAADVPIVFGAVDIPPIRIASIACASTLNTDASVRTQLRGSFDESLGGLVKLEASPGTLFSNVRGVVSASAITPDLLNILFS